MLKDLLVFRCSNDLFRFWCILLNNNCIRWWKIPTVISWTIFFVYEIVIGFDFLSNKSPLCTGRSSRVYPQWFNSTTYTILGGFVLLLTVFLYKMLRYQSFEEQILLFLSVSILSIGVAATALSVIFEWGGYCADRLG